MNLASSKYLVFRPNLDHLDGLSSKIILLLHAFMLIVYITYLSLLQPSNNIIR